MTSARQIPPLRLGHIDFLNSLPVMQGLLTGRVGTPFPLEITRAPPAVLNRRLLAGELDVSPVSTIAFGRHADELVLLPGLSINSRGFVDSVTLFHKDRLDVDAPLRVAVTDQAATSVALLKVLLGDWTRGPHEIVVTDAPIAALDSGAHAALLIGDAALTTQYTRPELLRRDLGEAWFRRTGRPMVFAVWAARRDVARNRPRDLGILQRALEASKAWGAAHPDEVVAAAVERSRLEPRLVAAYFRHLRFDLDAEALAGLHAFYEAAAGIGELPRMPLLAPVPEARA